MITPLFPLFGQPGYVPPRPVWWYNAAKCKGCGAIITSTHQHDFKWHACEKDPRIGFAVDGGRSYLRRLWDTERWPFSTPADHYEDLGHEIVRPDVAMGVPT